MRREGSIRARLRLGLALLSLTLLVVSLASVLSLRRVGDAIETLLRENYPSILACDEMNEALERQDSAVFFRASGREHVGFEPIETYRKTFVSALDRAEGSTLLPGEAERVEAVRKLHRAYAETVERVLQLPHGERVGAYFREVVPRFDRLKEQILALRGMNTAILDRSDRDAKALARRVLHVGIAISAAAALLAAWIAWWLGRSVVRPVDAFARAATSIGELDLDVRIPDPGVRELAPLAASFRGMLERLRAYRDRSQGELQAARDLAKTTVECLLDPVIVFDDRGAVRLANDAAERAFGIRAVPSEQRTPCAVPPEIAAARDRVLATDAPVLPRSLADAVRWSGGDGERYFLVRAAPLHGGAEAIDSTHVLVVAQDVTRFRRIDELKSDVVATVSHEFKTPLTSLRMATHLLLDPSSGPLTDAQREIVTTARDDTERLRAIVDELLDVVRIEAEAGALRNVTFDPADVFRSVVAAHRAVAREKGVTLEVDASSAAPIVGDPERLSIALANLVSNAVRHTPEGGRVVLSATAAGDAVRIVVSDTGEGIEAADLPRIFERTVKGGGGRERHGLGLSIAREIVHKHGGDIEVASTPGQGSTFAVVLPRTDVSA